tara:strand:- start:186 stop:968 length:783 start_codon:yes stop_codon:yes gene_type:complete
MNELKQKLMNIPVIGSLSIKLYEKFFRNNIPSTWVEKYLNNSDVTIIQIGSNDGKTGDPIFQLINKRKKWKAIFVEPVPYLYARLKANYGLNPRFIFENVAINDGSEQIFYAVKSTAKDTYPDLPSWFDQLSSFNRDNIINHLNGKLEPFIEEITLQGLTLHGLFLRNSIDFIDLLHIDTEGYDWKVLSQLQFDKLKPTLILFEHKHLRLAEKQQSLEFLNKNYCVFDFGSDYLAIKNNIIKGKDLNKIGHKMITQSNIV